jgi:hypothetical protein
MPSVNDVLREVLAERGRQDDKWGGSVNDDRKGPDDWHAHIADYNGWARNMARMGSLDKARRRLIQVAALATAAVEAIDRRQERHRIMTRWMQADQQSGAQHE